MIGEGAILHPVIVNVVLGLFTLALACAFIRLVLGPTLPDRVVALDLIASIIVGLAALEAIVEDLPVLLDVAIVVALVAFLGTVAFAKYMERRARDA